MENTHPVVDRRRCGRAHPTATVTGEAVRCQRAAGHRTLHHWSVASVRYYWSDAVPAAPDGTTARAQESSAPPA